jgi:hypothetical protein
VVQKALKMICNISEICSSLLVEQMGTALDAANRLPKTVKRIALNQAAGKVAVRVPSNCGVARVGIDFDLLFSHDLVCTGKVSFWPIPAAGRILPRPAAPGRARRFADRAMLGTAATRVQWRVDEEQCRSAIVKEIAPGHGGEMELLSSREEGTRVIFRFPSSRGSESKAPG